jgi:mannopine transport system permease protein
LSRRPSSWVLGGRHYSPAASLLLASPFLLLALVTFLLPLGSLLHESLFLPAPTLAHYERALGEPVYVRVMLRTLRIAVLVTFLTLILAWPLAWAMSRAGGVKLAILVASVLLPLWTSVLVRTYAWMVLLQKNGVINQVLMSTGVIGEPLKLLYTEAAVVFAMSHVLLPFMVLPIYSALRGIPDDYGRAAQMLGASDWATFREVIFPLSLPGVSSGCLMVFLLGFGFFVTPALIGGPQQMMIATLVSQQVREMLDWSFAGALVGVMLAFVLLIAILFRRVVRLDRFVGAA